MIRLSVALRTQLLNIFVVVSVLSLVGCTVTKRVHRKGFHIEWHRNYKTKQPKAERREEKVDYASSKQDRPHVDTILHSKASSFVAVATPREEESHPKAREIPTKHDVFPEGFSEKQAPMERHEPEDAIEEEIASNTKSRVDLDPMRVMAIVLLVLGGLFLLGSVFYLFGLGGMGALFDVLVFSGNGFFIGVLGFILFLIILLVVILFVFMVDVMGGFNIGMIAAGGLLALGTLLLILYFIYG